MPDFNMIIYAIEVHSVEEITAYFAQGGSPNEIHNGVPLFTSMVEMYSRGPRLKDCIRAFIIAGLIFEERALLAVLAQDAETLNSN